MASGKSQKSGLTAAWVKRARPKDKPYKLSDRDGLYLLIEPSGSRVWRMNYRLRGKQRTITFGRWPELPFKLLPWRSAVRQTALGRENGRSWPVARVGPAPMSLVGSDL